VLLPAPRSVELRPAALGFHPEQRIGAVLARIGLESRLLLYGATGGSGSSLLASAAVAAG